MRVTTTVTTRNASLRAAWDVLLVLAAFWIACGNPVVAQTSRLERSLKLVRDRYSDRQAKFARQMNELADRCEALSFFTDADRLRELAKPAESGAYNLDDLPETLLPVLPVTLPDSELEWRTKERKLRKDFAIDLYKLARDCIRQRHSSLAYRLVRESAFHDPDQRHVREKLGYVLDSGVWTTPFASKKKKQGYVDHPVYGWLLSRDVPRYEQGERFFNGAWMSEDKEKALRTDFRHAWRVESEHFAVYTNFSLEKGVELSRALEKYHDFFLREFAAFFSTPQQMVKLFDSSSVASRDASRPYEVYYYRNRDEFVAALKPRQPNIDVIEANGLYMPYDRRAYFFFDEENESGSLETLFHEVTHQLLGESTPKTVEVGDVSDFWVVEGLACYMESFDVDATPVSVGDPRHIRIYWARRKAIEEGFYVPMRAFTSMSKNDFQFPMQVEMLHPYYSQASGMVHFFMHYQDGAYRDAFIDYLAKVYSPVDRVRRSAPSLETLTGVSFEALDQQYKAYLQELPAGLPTQR